MARAVDERRKEAERLRDYFEVQLLFAETIAEGTSRTLSDACLEFTNLHRQFGFGRIEGGAPSAEWTRYAAELERRPSGPDRLDWTVAFFAETPPKESGAHRFGCFSYELLGREDVVRIHFSNRDSADDCGPLTRAKAERRISELREMFGFIGSRHPSVRVLRGGSWLYNLEAYRRLFPPEYAASVFVPDRVRLDGTSSWGQLIDFRGFVKPAIRQALLENIRDLDIAAPWKAFPMRALGTQCAIEHFYGFYGCQARLDGRDGRAR
jgi:hypothetical protein